jgi:hypothetical protein
MKIKKFNEIVGFDDEELRDRLEIPFLRGELEPSGKNMFSKKIESENTKSFIRKLVYRYPVLERLHLKIQNIDNIEVYNFYATSLEPKDGSEFYVQLSLAYNKGDYYCLAVLRGLEDAEHEDRWYKKHITTEDIEDTFTFIDAFLKASHGLNIVAKSHLEEGNFRNN